MEKSVCLSRSDFDEPLVGVAPVVAHLGLDGVAVGGEGVRLVQDRRAPLRRPIEGRHKEVKIHRKRVHRGHLNGRVLRTDEVGEERWQGVLAACPRQLPFKVTAHAHGAPLVQLAVDSRCSRLGHQTERVASHVSLLLRRAVLGDVEFSAHGAEGVVSIHRVRKVFGIQRQLCRCREDGKPCSAIRIGGSGIRGETSTKGGCRGVWVADPAPEEVRRRRCRRRRRHGNRQTMLHASSRRRTAARAGRSSRDLRVVGDFFCRSLSGGGESVARALYVFQMRDVTAQSTESFFYRPRESAPRPSSTRAVFEGPHPSNAANGARPGAHGSWKIS